MDKRLENNFGEFVMKKILKVVVVAEIEVDTDWYDHEKNIKDIEKYILEVEKLNYFEWLHDYVVSDKLTIRNK